MLAGCDYIYLRLIPAHAGKTARRGEEKNTHGAHPRACGENALINVALLNGEGSSPRMRGKQGWEGSQRLRPGLIPAHAGKTGDIQCQSFSYWAHPRACGENLLVPVVSFAIGGSSPRMRGKPYCEMRLCFWFGLIPAHAGKTRTRSGMKKPRWAHPRACGENQALRAPIRDREGSSPRMRGKREKRFVIP